MNDDSVQPAATANTSPQSGDNDDRLARLLLGRIGEPGDIALAKAIDSLGAVATVQRLRAGTLAHQGLMNLRARLDVARPDRDLAAGALVGARFVIPGDPEWPDQVDDLVRLGRDASVPLGLWVRGPLDLRVACQRSVAVVGARASTAYGDYVASEFGIGLAERSWTVVSGGAFGID
ncbi:MAG TPA: DNA-processing protein DprA, partial [Acidothermaceae bacterium]|nr:DNA-processing protein DprA [Acidothermaceae bacterium]